MATGGCHCGAIRYEATGQPEHHAICHCSDCRKAAGAPMVGWIAFATANVTVTKGSPSIYASNEHARRHFCGTCGTGLFYTNEVMLPGIIDIQSATLDDPEAMPPGAQIQYAEHLNWTETMGELPRFERYPG